MIENYYNDNGEIKLRRYNKIVNGKYVYDKEVILPCFVRFKQEMVRDKTNNETVSIASYSTMKLVRIDDMIDDKIVKMVQKPRGYNFEYYRAYV